MTFGQIFQANKNTERRLLQALSSSQDCRANFALAKYYYESGQVDKASSRVEQTLQIDAGDEAALVLAKKISIAIQVKLADNGLALYCHEQQKSREFFYAHVISHYNTAFKLALEVRIDHPEFDFNELYYKCAHAYSLLPDYDEVEANLGSLLRAKPFHLAGLLLRTKLYREKVVEPSHRAAMNQLLYDTLRLTVQHHPQSAQAHYELGVWYYCIAETDRALQHFNHAITHHSSEQPLIAAHQLRADILSSEGQFAQALRDYNVILVAHPGHLQAYFGKAICLMALDQPKLALQSLTKVLWFAPALLGAFRDEVAKIKRPVQFGQGATAALAMQQRDHTAVAVNPANASDALIERLRPYGEQLAQRPHRQLLLFSLLAINYPILASTILPFLPCSTVVGFLLVIASGFSIIAYRQCNSEFQFTEAMYSALLSDAAGLDEYLSQHAKQQHQQPQQSARLSSHHYALLARHYPKHLHEMMLKEQPPTTSQMIAEFNDTAHRSFRTKLEFILIVTLMLTPLILLEFFPANILLLCSIPLTFNVGLWYGYRKFELLADLAVLRPLLNPQSRITDQRLTLEQFQASSHPQKAQTQSAAEVPYPAATAVGAAISSPANSS